MRAVISLGTNSTRLLIVHDAPGGRCATVYHETRGTRLGAGLREGGHLDPGGTARTLDAVRAYEAIARKRRASIAVIATSAMRRADDAAGFAERVAEAAGAPVRVLAGDEEARLSFLGATAALAAEPGVRVGVLDVGGGSSDYASGDLRAPESIETRSIEIGAVRAAERFPAILGERALTSDEAARLERDVRSAVRELLAPLGVPPAPSVLYGVGGTVMTAAAIVADRPRPQASGVTIARADLARLAAMLLGRSREERLAVARMNAQRADILPAGLFVVDEACAALGADRLTTSAGDLLLGYLCFAPLEERSA